MAEMTAVEYLKTKARMVNAEEDGACTIDCRDCPLSSINTGKDMTCINFDRAFPEEAISIVKKWAEEHPQKTILMDLLEKYPNALIESDGIPNFCPESLGYKRDHEICDSLDDNNCKKCWNRPLEE